MTTPACEDAPTIREAMARIEREEGPRCPNSSQKSRYDCVRESAQCPETCINHEMWKRLHP